MPRIELVRLEDEVHSISRQELIMEKSLKINEHLTRKFWDILKRNHIRITRAPQAQEYNSYEEATVKDVAEKFTELESACTHTLEA